MDTGDLTGREADVIAGEPIVTPLFGRGGQTLVAGALMCGAAVVPLDGPLSGGRDLAVS